MTNSAVTEHYPGLALLAALIYSGRHCEMLRSDAKFYQTWSHINLVTAGAKVLPL